MVRHQDTLWCDGCGIEIRWEPIEQNGLFFCCQKCLEGEECDCGDEDDEYPAPGQLSRFHIPSTTG